MRVEVRKPARARLDAFALMDSIFLVAMVFFYLILSMTRHYGIGVELPSAETTVANEEEYISVSIDGDDRIYLNGAVLPAGKLAERLTALPNDDRPVYLEADETSSYRAVMRALDSIRQAGLDDVSLEAEHAGAR